jgi:hypothetical protein
VTTEHETVQPGSTLSPGRDDAARARRPARKEPSWGRVLLTTVELWASRRMVRAHVSRRPGPDQRPRYRKPAATAAVAVTAATAATLGGLQLSGAFAATTARSDPLTVSAAPAATSAPAITAAPASSARPAATVRPSAPAQAVPAPLAKAETEAATWIAGQVSRGAAIGCDPAVCPALQAGGISASRLVPLGAGLSGVRQAAVIAVPATVSPRVVDQVAPGLVAAFGSGGSRVEVRAVVPGGAAAYQAAWRSDLSARKSAGAQLLGNPRLRFAPGDATLLRAGKVDARVLATLAALSSQFKLRVAAFTDAAPGAEPLFRGVVLTGIVSAGKGAASFPAALALVDAQRGPYVPVTAVVTTQGGARPALSLQFAAPNPLGLLTPALTADVQRGGDASDG